MAVSGLGVTYSVTGFLLLYSGLKNVTLKDELTSFLKGQPPQANLTGPPVIGINSGSSSASSAAPPAAGTATGNSISQDAQRYAGHPYRYGGAPGTNGQAPWDCSSFCNWVLGHDLGYTLPGQSSPGYSGTSHGPDTLQYLVWSRAKTIGNSAAQAAAGDLCVWQTHMGIALGNGNMISALNQSLGTRITTIPGGSPGAEALFVRRIT